MTNGQETEEEATAKEKEAEEKNEEEQNKKERIARDNQLNQALMLLKGLNVFGKLKI